jgi:hypothetical protein
VYIINYIVASQIPESYIIHEFFCNNLHLINYEEIKQMIENSLQIIQITFYYIFENLTVDILKSRVVCNI